MHIFGQIGTLSGSVVNAKDVGELQAKVLNLLADERHCRASLANGTSFNKGDIDNPGDISRPYNVELKTVTAGGGVEGVLRSGDEFGRLVVEYIRLFLEPSTGPYGGDVNDELGYVHVGVKERTGGPQSRTVPLRFPVQLLVKDDKIVSCKEAIIGECGSIAHTCRAGEYESGRDDGGTYKWRCHHDPRDIASATACTLPRTVSTDCSEAIKKANAGLCPLKDCVKGLDPGDADAWVCGSGTEPAS